MWHRWCGGQLLAIRVKQLAAIRKTFTEYDKNNDGLVGVQDIARKASMERATAIVSEYVSQ